MSASLSQLAADPDVKAALARIPRVPCAPLPASRETRDYPRTPPRAAYTDRQRTLQQMRRQMRTLENMLQMQEFRRKAIEDGMARLRRDLEEIL